MASGSSTDETGPPHRIPDSPEEARGRKNLLREEVEGGEIIVASALRKPAPTCERASKATALEECGLNRFGHVSPFVCDVPPAQFAPI
ncbi:hypothetical protein CN233_07970 [Sinorhizobium meliloti]|nr:hypothetical protein CN233_07970 [Sinorhizobium meliloti]RVN79159.1 hypothetical protein CN105_30045 [Sinorhizobium meliloti]